MRISPIFLQQNRTKSNMSGQTFQKMDCRKPHDLGIMGSYSSNDVFMRLAEASLRDSKIEHELQLMELI